MRAESGKRRGRLVPPVFALPARAWACVLLFVLAGVLLGCGQAGDASSTSAPTGAASATSSTSGNATAPGVRPTAQPTVADVAATVPGRIAGMPLREYLDGEQARTQVEQLHGKGLGAGLDEAWLAAYGDSEPATLWVSRSVRLEDAKALMDRMKTKIAGGGSPFTNPQTLTVQGIEVEALDGMGQKHYYFRVDKDLYWLAIAPRLGDVGLRELVATGLRAAKTD